MPNLKLIKKVIQKEGGRIIKLYQGESQGRVVESACKDHNVVNENFYHEVESISLKKIIKDYSPSLVKLDIEGTEYDVFDDCFGIKQICIEFHHRLMNNKHLEDTMRCLNLFRKNGYKVFDFKGLKWKGDYSEFTFLKL